MTIDDLKCCGNCNFYEHAHNTCPLEVGIREGWELCDKWVYDEFKQQSRLPEEYNGN